VGSEVFTIKSTTVAAGDYDSQEMPLHFSAGYISIRFLDGDDSIVTPTAGTVVFQGSEYGDAWGEIATLNANFIGPNVEYTRPAFAGPMKYIRATLGDISSNAEQFSVSIARYS